MKLFHAWSSSWSVLFLPTRAHYFGFGSCWLWDLRLSSFISVTTFWYSNRFFGIRGIRRLFTLLMQSILIRIIMVRSSVWLSLRLQLSLFLWGLFCGMCWWLCFSMCVSENCLWIEVNKYLSIGSVLMSCLRLYSWTSLILWRLLLSWHLFIVWRNWKIFWLRVLSWLVRLSNFMVL